MSLAPAASRQRSAPNVPRQPASVRRAVTESLQSVLDFLMRLTPGKSAVTRREKAIVLFASRVGALVAARAVNDPQLSEEILQAVSRSLATRCLRALRANAPEQWRQRHRHQLDALGMLVEPQCAYQAIELFRQPGDGALTPLEPRPLRGRDARAEPLVGALNDLQGWRRSWPAIPSRAA